MTASINPAPTDIPPAGAFMPLLQFTPDDLDANRAGNMGDNQINRLKNAQTRVILVGIGVFYAMAFIATLFLYAGTQSQSPILSLIGALIVVLNGIFVGLAGRQYMRLRADMRDKTVETVSGKIERVIRPGRRFSHYIIRLNETELAVKKEVFAQFRHEMPYHLYLSGHTKTLLAAEPVLE